MPRSTNYADPVPNIEIDTGKTAYVLRAPSGAPFFAGEQVRPDSQGGGSHIPNPASEIPLLVEPGFSFTVTYRTSEADAWGDLPRTRELLHKHSWK